MSLEANIVVAAEVEVVLADAVQAFNFGAYSLAISKSHLSMAKNTAQKRAYFQMY